MSHCAMRRCSSSSHAECGTPCGFVPRSARGKFFTVESKPACASSRVRRLTRCCRSGSMAQECNAERCSRSWRPPQNHRVATPQRRDCEGEAGERGANRNQSIPHNEASIKETHDATYRRPHSPRSRCSQRNLRHTEEELEGNRTAHRGRHRGRRG